MTKPKPKTLADADAALTRATRRLRKANDRLYAAPQKGYEHGAAMRVQQRAQQNYFKAQAEYHKAKNEQDNANANQ